MPLLLCLVASKLVPEADRGTWGLGDRVPRAEAGWWDGDSLWVSLQVEAACLWGEFPNWGEKEIF